MLAKGEIDNSGSEMTEEPDALYFFETTSNAVTHIVLRLTRQFTHV